MTASRGSATPHRGPGLAESATKMGPACLERTTAQADIGAQASRHAETVRAPSDSGARSGIDAVRQPRPARRGTAAAVVVALLSGCAGFGARGPEAAASGGPTASAAAPAPLSRERIAEIVASPDRSAADRTNDQRRKPAEMLAFIGVRPGSVALDLSAGGGYTTELLARAVGPTGHVYGQSAPRDPGRAGPAAPEGAAAPSAAPAAPPRTSATALAERARKPATPNITAVVQRFESPVPAALAGDALDLVTLMFNYHDLGHLGVDRAAMNAAVFRALKPGGVYVIADHAGRPGTGISESGTLHRVEEAFVRREVEAAGFRLVASGDFLRNPNDPRDRNVPEPPQPKDEFVLKFVKPTGS
jgi:predicted methyltransferase